MLEVGKVYKIVYKDQDYTKFVKGKLVSEDAHLIKILDSKLGEIIVGKSSITSIKEVKNAI